MRDGFCDFTAPGPSDCSNGDKGSWTLTQAHSANWTHAVKYCKQLCLSCKACRFYSVSLRHSDCSWFRQCDWEQLQQSVRGFRTMKVVSRITTDEQSDFRHRERFPCLANKRIVYLGDSTLRYEYLALAFLAEHGELPSTGHTLCPPHDGVPNFQVHDLLRGTSMRQAALASIKPAAVLPQCAPSWQEWDVFYQCTNRLLHSSRSAEYCDCYRQRCCDDAIENRIYVNARLNTSIAFFQWQGSYNQPRGTESLWQFMRNFRAAEPWPSSRPTRCPVGSRYVSRATGKEPAWQAHADVFLESIVRSFKPTDVIVNAGWWSTSDLDAVFWESLARAGAQAMPHGGTAWWRTTQRPTVMSPFERHRLGTMRLGKKAAFETTFEVNTSIFLDHGWRIYDAKALVHDYMKQRQLSDSATFVDSIHLFPHANVALVREMIRAVLCKTASGNAASPPSALCGLELGVAQGATVSKLIRPQRTSSPSVPTSTETANTSRELESPARRFMREILHSAS